MGKGGDAATIRTYYGTFGALICAGPIAKLYQIWADGELVVSWPDGLDAAGDSTDITSAIDPQWFGPKGGTAIIHWGTATQIGPAWLPQANYRHCAWLAFRYFRFGAYRGGPPNIQVVAARLPQVPITIVPAAYNVLVDGRANPIAIIAELLLSHWGLAWPESMLDAASWQTAAAEAHAGALTSFVAPLLTGQTNARSIIARLLHYCRATLYWTAQGTLAIRIRKPGQPDPASPTFDYTHLTEPPSISIAGPGGVPTGWVITYTDRDRGWKTTSERLDNLAAQDRRAEEHRITIDAPDVMTGPHARAILAEYARDTARPQASVSAAILRAHAAQLTPGATCWIDLEPEPGGTGFLALCRIRKLSRPPAGPISIEADIDPAADIVPYANPEPPPAPAAASCAPITQAIVIPLSSDGTGHQPAIAVLAARPQPDAIGYAIHLGTDPNGDFTPLGISYSWAQPCSLEYDIAADDDALAISIPSGPDDWYPQLAPGEDLGAMDDRLLLVLAKLAAGTDRVVIDADGSPVVEILSIRTASPAGSSWDLLAWRGRMGTIARDWTSADTVGWLIPGALLQPFTHDTILQSILDGTILYLRLTAFTDYAADASTPVPQRTIVMPPSYNIRPTITWLTPASSPHTLPDSGQLSPDADITDPGADIRRITLWYVDEQTGSRATILDEPIHPSAAVSLADLLSGPLTFGPQTSSPQYYTLWLAAEDTAGAYVASSRSLVLPPSGGPWSGPQGVVIQPDALEFTTSLDITITAQGATMVQYAITPLGSGRPTTWITDSSPVQTTIYQSRRIWARAWDGTQASAWAYRDYIRRAAGSSAGWLVWRLNKRP